MLAWTHVIFVLGAFWSSDRNQSLLYMAADGQLADVIPDNRKHEQNSAAHLKRRMRRPPPLMRASPRLLSGPLMTGSRSFVDARKRLEETFRLNEPRGTELAPAWNYNHHKWKKLCGLRVLRESTCGGPAEDRCPAVPRCPRSPLSRGVSRGHVHVRAAKPPPPDRGKSEKEGEPGPVTNKSHFNVPVQEVTHVHAHAGVLVSTCRRAALLLSH